MDEDERPESAVVHSLIQSIQHSILLVNFWQYESALVPK
ncbi:hypothetical protein EAG_06508 [Camponotus floridanus]|uniref:Uncharacterized protein n=1 Tax=Camponotus floridanus TaxID=104421 RepID=E2AF46_CAMFO|nr:hypothetical protein EAG_06508 [Camponotus floridanus]